MGVEEEVALEVVDPEPDEYTLRRFEPPQNSVELPLQTILLLLARHFSSTSFVETCAYLHPVEPSGAGPPPLLKEFPQ